MPKPKKIARQAAQKSSTETSTTSYGVELDPAFHESLRTRGRPQSKVLGEAMRAAAESWGFPHKHAGLGIRHLRKNLYECRSGLKTRLLFLVFPGVLYFLKEGSHDEVRDFLRNH